MKRILFTLSLALLLTAPNFALAASENLGFIKPDSSMYFLQTWGESTKAALIFNKEKKTDYLLELSDRRTAEIENYSDKIDQKKLESISESYQKNFEKIEIVSAEVKNKAEVDKRIAEANTRQQEILKQVLNKAPEAAKAAIKNAQANSSKNIQKILEDNPELLQNYTIDSTSIIEGKMRSQVETEVKAKVETEAKIQAEAKAKEMQATGQAAGQSQAAQAEAAAKAQAQAKADEMKAAAEAGQAPAGSSEPTPEQIQQYQDQAKSLNQTQGDSQGQAAGGSEAAAMEQAAREQAAQQQYGR
ncbi:MAG: DUF5667 domain-containing protein [Patescibacteria group bacterium]|jgi:hypothetical protein